MIEMLRPALIAGLVLTEVGLWQWRVLIASRGNRGGAVALGAVGAILQITAISQVVTNVTDPLSIAAYAIGVGAGVLLGLVAGDRLSPGRIGVTVVSEAPDLAAALWSRGWPVTAQTALGANGPVAVLTLTLSRRHEARLHRDVMLLAPDATWKAEDLRKRPTAEVPRLITPPADRRLAPLRRRSAGHASDAQLPGESGRLPAGAHVEPAEDRRDVMVRGLA